ncbi:MAG: diaminopimelate decarboxylase, partial [Saezia sp.]
CGFDIVSGGELQRALAAGAQPETIVFSGVGKTRAEMRMALEANIKCFNVESIPELDTLASIAKELKCRAPISLRVNPDIDAKTHPYISTGLKNNKFGIAFEQALDTYLYAAKLPELNIVGIDCHLGSQITETQPYLDAFDKLVILIKELASAGITLSHLDLGGGLGIAYTDETPPTPETLYGAILERMQQHGLEYMELLVEPGRSIVAHAGVLVTETLYLKHGENKNFCIVDAAFNDLVRPAIYDAYHQILEVNQCTKEQNIKCYDVVGPICESTDVLGKDRDLAVQQGDLLAILSCGAYGKSMASNYNSRPRAAEVLVDGSHVHLIAERETLASLYANEHLLKL